MNRFKYPLLLIICLLSIQVVWSQETSRVRGKVTDDDRKPLSGASVKILDNLRVVNTNTAGEFEIECTPEDILVISYIGYDEQQVAVRGRSYLEVIMQRQPNVLEDVVVVGYGTQKRTNVTGAVTSVNYSEQAASRPITTTAGALAGLSPGLAVQQPSGRPGSEGVMLRVRGVGTLNNAAPLVIVDGFESSIGN